MGWFSKIKGHVADGIAPKPAKKSDDANKRWMQKAREEIKNVGQLQAWRGKK